MSTESTYDLRGRPRQFTTTTRCRSPSAPPQVPVPAEQQEAQVPAAQTLDEEISVTVLAALEGHIDNKLAQQEARQKRKEQELTSTINRLEHMISQLLASSPAPADQQGQQVPAFLDRLPSATPSSDSNTSKLRVEDFPKFNGTVTDKFDVDDWLQQVTAIFEFSGAQESQLLRLIPRLLEDAARGWFTDLGPQRSKYTTWSQWQDAFKNAFRAPNYLDRIHTALNHRHLGQDESFATYFHDKLRLLNKRYGKEISDSMKIAEIRTGLPITMAPFIQASQKEDMSLEDFRRLLLELEEGLRAQQQQKTGPPTKDQRNRIVAAQVPQNQQHQVRTAGYQPNYHQNDPALRSSCFKCGQPGHWSRTCPNVQGAMPAQASSNNAVVFKEPIDWDKWNGYIEEGGKNIIPPYKGADDPEVSQQTQEHC